MTGDELNPQAREMADESMVRNLAAQAEAIWPQERVLFERYHLPEDAQVLDAGCGTGEISVRIAQMLPHARVLDWRSSTIVPTRSRWGRRPVRSCRISVVCS